MKKIILSLIFMFMTYVSYSQTSVILYSNSDYIFTDLRSGTCSSPNGNLLQISSPPNNYTYLYNNGYCYSLSPSQNNFTACFTFISPGTSVSINSGYSQNGCANISFGNFYLYNSSCSLISTGLNFSGLTPGATYTWCFSGSSWGGGPSCTGFNNICPYFQNTTPLPIELLEFYGNNETHYNILYWTTSTENNNNFFTLERSSNAIDWEFVSYVDGSGSTNSPIKYSYKDYGMKKNMNYYRLSQTDFNGDKEYFDIISIDNKQSNNVKHLIKEINVLGQEITSDVPGLHIFMYSDGSIFKIYK